MTALARPGKCDDRAAMGSGADAAWAVMPNASESSPAKAIFPTPIPQCNINIKQPNYQKFLQGFNYNMMNSINNLVDNQFICLHDIILNDNHRLVI